MTVQLLPIEATTYEPHRLHAGERTWSETNCYVDVWVEVLHALGLEPLAAAAFTLSTDFEGEQWTFFKFPPEDLRAQFGIEVAEMNVWRPLADHVADQLDLGRLLTVEVDAWYLPDTREVSYHQAHTKTTIVPQMLDVDGRRMGYFHGPGYFELSDVDFDGVMGAAGPEALPPYVELVRLERMRGADADVVGGAVQLTSEHLSRRPTTSPMLRLKKRIEADLPWLAAQDLETFHRYAFGTCRQCGASAELAAAFVEWLDVRDGGGLGPVAERLRAVATGAKALQFALARVVRGRQVDLEGPLGEMEVNWEEAIASLSERYER